MVFNLLKHTVLLSLHITNGYGEKCIFAAERLTAYLISDQYSVPLSETVYNYLIAISIIAIAVLLIFRLVLRLWNLKRDIKYVNMEIRRTRGSERKHWKKEKRRLWLSLIPFYKR